MIELLLPGARNHSKTPLNLHKELQTKSRYIKHNQLCRFYCISWILLYRI